MPIGLLIDLIYMIKVEYMSAEDRIQFDEDLAAAGETEADRAKARREFAEQVGEVVYVKRR